MVDGISNWEEIVMSNGSKEQELPPLKVTDADWQAAKLEMDEEDRDSWRKIEPVADRVCRERQLREAHAQITTLTEQVEELKEEIAGRKEQVSDLADAVFDSDDVVESLKAELAALREGAKVTNADPWAESMRLYQSGERKTIAEWTEWVNEQRRRNGLTETSLIPRERILDTAGEEG